MENLIKKCSKCELEHDINNFYKYFKTSKNDYHIDPVCKTCKKLKNKQNYLNNIDKYKQKTNEYYLNNKEIILEKRKKKYENNIDKYKQINKENYDLEYHKKYYKKNKEYLKEKRKQNDIKNADKIKENNAKYYLANKEKINIRNKEYHKNKKKIDPLFKLRCSIASLISISIKKQGFKKDTKTANILGCSFEEFRDYLEKQFDENMNWDNQGSYWHLDHIKPISLATNEQEIIKLNHYTNFQPLFWKDNLSKSNKITYDNTKI